MTTNTKIQKTTDYDIFISNSFQRQFRPKGVKDIMESMKKHGFIPSKAISVHKKGNKLVINTGHHRHAAAKALGIPVYYVIEHEWTLEEMVGEGVNVTQWSLSSAAQSYARVGNEDYQELLSYADKGIPLNMAASMLVGEAAASGNVAENIKKGTFKIKTREMIIEILTIIERFPSIDALKSRTFIGCYSKCLLTPEFDKKRFHDKLKYMGPSFEKHASNDVMLRQIEEVYNYRHVTKIPLAFLVNENSKSRQAMLKPASS